MITGPNAGGKTVALKTLGLLVLMAQSGCHVPARDGARLPVFSQCFAIVGDEQSVAENLSTFSAFVKQLREVLERVDARSLVLLDELGAGTDPDDGAALAQAVLEDLAERGAVVRGLHPPRAAQGLRLHASEGPQRLGGVRSPSGSRPPSGSSTIARGRATRSPSAPASACPPR